MNFACGSETTKKSTDSVDSLEESFSSDDYENDSDTSASYSCNEDITEYRKLAAIIVDNLLSKALTKASEEVSQSKGLYIDLQLKTNQNDFENVPPEIQIDLVGSRTPSPVEESIFDWSVNRKQYKFKNSYDQQSTSVDTDFSINDFEVSEKDENSVNKDSIYDSSKNLNEIRAFAKEYVKNIISSALETAIANTCAQTTRSGEDVSLLRNSRSNNQGFVPMPWYSRVREVFRRLMRSGCLCKNKEEFRQKKT
jgi:hypothetical protein